MNCKNCKNWVFGRCTVSNFIVGPGQLCNAWELSQSHEMVTMPFATFDDKELQERIAELEAFIDKLIEAGSPLCDYAILVSVDHPIGDGQMAINDKAAWEALVAEYRASKDGGGK